jgi:SAM-dependent methyltransferase
VGEDPFADVPLQRHAWAYRRLAGRHGPHLDIGSAGGAFPEALSRQGGRRCVAVERVATPGTHAPDELVSVRAEAGALPFAGASFASVSLLDVLEHVADEAATLSEASRVLRPGGTLAVSVPAQHAFSWLDPDNAAFAHPRLHRLIWSARFGRATYEDRFEGDPSWRGDVAGVRGGHTNYAPATLSVLLGRSGLVVEEMSGSGLWFRWFQIPALVLPGRAGALFDRAMAWDGRARTGAPGTGLTRRANLFVLARKPAGSPSGAVR